MCWVRFFVGLMFQWRRRRSRRNFFKLLLTLTLPFRAVSFAGGGGAGEGGVLCLLAVSAVLVFRLLGSFGGGFGGGRLVRGLVT